MAGLGALQFLEEIRKGIKWLLLWRGAFLFGVDVFYALCYDGFDFWVFFLVVCVD